MKLRYLFENLVFPPKCANCGRFLKAELAEKINEPLCPVCRLRFESEKSLECGRCGLSMKFCRCMPKAMERAQCISLLKLISYRAEGHSMPIRNMLYSVKHIKNKDLFSFLAEQMRASLIVEMRALSLLPDDCVITYLPRSYKNKREDGFDQSLRLAEALSYMTGIKLVRCFSRKVWIQEQKNLNSYERSLNMNTAYQAVKLGDRIKDKTVILVDDIVTTGASMASCARLAYENGAYAVLGICIGLTEREKNKNKN